MNQGSLLSSIRWRYWLIAGIAGAVVSMILLAIVYTSTSSILFNPQLQSSKVLAVYQTIQPLPLLTTNLPVFALGSIVLSMTRTFVFAWFYKGIPGVGVRKGLAWGIAVWITVILFQEYYTAINLLGEPVYLAAFEFALQIPPYLGEGLVVAAIYGRARV